MKLTAINNTATQNKSIQKQNQKNVSFKGFADTAVVFWKFVDNGGRAIQFTVEDMFGTNIPRTYKGAMAGYKYTGKVNVPALIQEAIREFLTGPTMSTVPFLVLAAATKLAGKTTDTHVENIRNLSHLASQLPKENVTQESFKKDFINKVVTDMLEKSTDSVKEEDVKTLTRDIAKYDELTSAIKSAKTRSDKKAAKKAAKESLEDLQETFEHIVKAGKKDYKGVDFQAAKYSISNSARDIGSTKFSNYVKYITAYSEDYAKKNTIDNIVDLSENAIKKFRRNSIANRSILIVSMIALTTAALSIIPKLYTLASGKVNPNAASIYNEAKKQEGK